jgi:HlyD family secretion protein
VVPGTPIFRIADTQQLWIAAMVDEREAGKLRVGQPARITFRAYAGQSFPGRLARLAREADRVTEEREADVTVDRLPPEWFIGAKADVYIETVRKTDAQQIPRSALVAHGDKPGVFVINGGHAHWQPVEVGLIGRDAVELIGGVDARDWVIADPLAGQNPIADGQRVASSGAQERP